MPLDNIVTKIKQDAQKKAQQLINEGQAEGKEYTEKKEAQIKAECDQLLVEGKAQTERQKRQQIQLVLLNARKQILKEKQDLLSKVFAQALKELEQLEDSRYRELIIQMLINYSPEGNAEIIVSKEDKLRLGDNFIQQVNQYLAGQGKNGQCQWSAEERALKGGFILRQGQVESNFSFEAIFKSKRDELEQEVARVLFG